ncbi:hypothetical protein [Luteibacter sp. Lutesp34]|uniref:hypothetical protein n=1 Tax=Luteibacter sp. Lutesp34 TaxID=3243030 RepID=UPI0039B365E5
MPIVRIALPSSPAADAVFAFRAQDQTGSALAAVTQEVPTISEASGDSGRKLLIADFIPDTWLAANRGRDIL